MLSNLSLLGGNDVNHLLGFVYSFVLRGLQEPRLGAANRVHTPRTKSESYCWVTALP